MNGVCIDPYLLLINGVFPPKDYAVSNATNPCLLTKWNVDDVPFDIKYKGILHNLNCHIYIYIIYLVIFIIYLFIYIRESNVRQFFCNTIAFCFHSELARNTLSKKGFCTVHIMRLICVEFCMMTICNCIFSILAPCYD